MLHFPKSLNSDQSEFPYSQLCKHNLNCPDYPIVPGGFCTGQLFHINYWQLQRLFRKGKQWKMKKDFPLNFLNLAGRITSYASDNATTQQVQALKTQGQVCLFQNIFVQLLYIGLIPSDPLVSMESMP